MKNKAVTYILIFVVALVWGIIIYRILGAANSDDDVQILSRPVVQKTKTEDYADVKDTSHLLLNYPDPFVKHDAPTPKPVEARSVISKEKSLNPIKPAINWGFINYSGFIKNANSKKTLTIISINGKQYMLNEGETADNVKLLKNMVDSVKILYHGNSKFIIMNNK